MTRRMWWLMVVLGSGMAAAPAGAHHAFAAVFDRDTPVELIGTVTQVEWMNPHVWFYIEVESGDGKTDKWGLEMGSPNALARRGWRSNTLEAGTQVKVMGFRAKDGTSRGAVETVTLENGDRLFGAQDKSR